MRRGFGVRSASITPANREENRISQSVFAQPGSEFGKPRERPQQVRNPSLTARTTLQCRLEQSPAKLHRPNPHGITGTVEMAFCGEPSISLSLMGEVDQRVPLLVEDPIDVRALEED